jgi:hypothetical protein
MQKSGKVHAWPLNTWRESARYPVILGLSGPQNLSRRYREKFLVPAGKWTPAIQPVAHRYIQWNAPAPYSYLYFFKIHGS